jgi:hypothetical protein
MVVVKQAEWLPEGNTFYRFPAQKEKLRARED